MNLLKFENTTERFLKIANQKQNREEFASALSTLYFALKKEKNGSERAKIHTKIAELYKDINNPFKAIDHTFSALNETKTIEEKGLIYRALANYFLALNKFDLADIYFKKADLLGAFEDWGDKKEVLLEKFQELIDEPEYRLVKSELDIDYDIMKEAEKFIRKNDYQKAIEEYLKITPTSDYYDQAIINLSFCYEELGQKEVAVKLLETASKLNSSLSILARLISIYQEVDENKAKSYYKKLLKKEVKEFEELNLVMIVASTLEDDQVVLTTAEKILEQKLPNDYYFLIGIYGFLGIANYNLKNFKKAKEYLKMQNDLLGGDDACEYYIADIDKILNGKKRADKIERINYGKELPKKEVENKINKILTLFLGEKDKELTPPKEEVIKNEQVIRWGIDYGNKNLLKVIINGVFRVDKDLFLDYFNSLLLNRYTDGECKKWILKKIASSCLVKEVSLVAENIYKNISLPTGLKDHFLEAYLNLVCLTKTENFEDFFAIIKLAEENYNKIKNLPRKVIVGTLTAYADQNNQKTWLKKHKIKKNDYEKAVSLIKGESYENN
ncbi:MAG: hypothetical protein IKC71_00960 [Clostridia bacterium]|nr:hypothetical protein [Clostridia bacterium]